MKKLILFVAVVLIVQSAQSQIIDSMTTSTNQEMYDFLMTKSKKQKKTGLILLGSGLVATGAGLLIMSNTEVLGSEWGVGGLVYSAGVLTSISSIPVLIIAGNNKKKAEIYARMGQYRMLDFDHNDFNTVAVGLKIRF